MTDTAFYARLNRHQTQAVCGKQNEKTGQFDCGAAFGDVKRAEQTFYVPTAEIGGPVSTTEYLEVAAGELYVETLPGYLMRDDGFYDVSGSRLGHWRAHGLPAAPRFARGEKGDIVKGRVGWRCARCRREQVLDTSRLNVAQRS